jgi:hypothetical protein
MGVKFARSDWARRMLDIMIVRQQSIKLVESVSVLIGFSSLRMERVFLENSEFGVDGNPPTTIKPIKVVFCRASLGKARDKAREKGSRQVLIKRILKSETYFTHEV